MACKGCTCSSSKTNDTVAGCGSNGCSSGGCNRMNTFDWLTALDIDDFDGFDVVEVSFKNGSRKEFYKNPTASRAITGDMVLVEADNNGYDLGRISLSGELVRIQMKKRGVKENTMFQNVIRKANERDLERLQEARDAEKNTMVQARVIARALGLDMKIGDVEFQGDKRKATFFYTADGRVDFRELIREYAREFKVKIEMRQIGARQESARVGGLGPCGRELCCSTWLTDFKSVSTTAARYQNLAINQSKLSGQCGRLKCCLNYELDSYLDALEQFPTRADRIYTEEGAAVLMKTDIFKGLMYYCYEKDHGRGKFYPLEIEQVKEVQEMNRAGMKPTDLMSLQLVEEEEEEVGFDGDLTGVVELPNERKKKKKKKKKVADSRRDDRNEQNSKPNFNPKREKTTAEGKATDAPNEQKDKRDQKRSGKEQQDRNNNRPPRDENKDNRPPRQDNRPPRDENRDNRPPRQDNRPPRDENKDNRPPRQDNRPPRDENRDNRPPRQDNRPPRDEQVTTPPSSVNVDSNEAPKENNNNQENNNKPPFKKNKWRNKNRDNKPPNTD
jgi:cell fate regulator YaaT (PSP1 superfamily)